MSDINNIIIQKVNGVTTTSPNTLEKRKEINPNGKKHMCWEYCSNGYPSKCPKIADILKKNIDEYDFITDGIQIINENGELETFLVYSCKNYTKSVSKKRTLKENLELQRIKESLLLYYIDASSLEEAMQIREDLIRRQKNNAIKTLKKIKDDNE